MRAAVQTRYGGPEVVRVEEVETPKPAADEILVEVRAGTVNRTDCGFRAARPFFVRAFAGLTKPKHPTLGTDFAGVIVDIGGDVTALTVGQRVFGFDDARFGGHGAFLARRAAAALGTIPDDVSFEEAASVVEGTHYARAFIRVAGIVPGDRVVVNGATGASGVAVLPLSKKAGAHVTAVCEGTHTDLVRDLGADRVIDRTTTDFTALGDTFDLVLDAVGKSSFARCRRILGPKGVYVSSELGPKASNPFLALATRLSPGRRVRFPFPKAPTNDEMRDFASMLASGELRPVIDRRYPLDDIADAYRYVESGTKVGSVVLDLATG
jgi:NADPH:quinone reductase-like Zn-dependent oxidoreductase